MPRLILVISDLYPARAQPPLPRLAQLEHWLARARRSALDAGWQQWLLEACCAGRYASQSWAQIAAAAVPALAAADAAGPAPALWLATPVHLVAGLDTVRVHPAGLLRLTVDEQQALARDFAVVFQGSGWTVHATGQRELLLQADRALHAHSSDPARWLGSDPAAGMMAGADAAPLRRLGAEMEMWLHEHPVNRARSGRGQLPVSGLWLWGGEARARANAGQPSRMHLASRLHAESLASAPPRIYGADLFLEGLRHRVGASSAALPMPWPEHDTAPGAAGDVIVHWQLGPTPNAARLQAFDQQLVAPLLRQLGRGAWDSLTLLAADQALGLRRNGWRVWKALTRSDPWWERLLG